MIFTRIYNKIIKCARRYMLMIVAYIFILIPFLLTIVYSVPGADDFFLARKNNENIFIFAVIKTRNYYLGKSGQIPTLFFQFLLNPLSYSIYSGHGHSIGIMLCVFFVLFVFILSRYVVILLNKFFCISDKRISEVISLLFVFCFLNLDIYPEIMTEFVGNSYLWGIMFILLCQISFIEFMNKPTVMNCLIACIMGFIGCFTYPLAVFSGMMYLFAMLKSKTTKFVYMFTPLLFMILGGCIAAFAPGNFVRHAATDSSLNLKQAFISALQNEISLFFDVHCMPLVILFALLAILFGYIFVNQKPYNVIGLLTVELISEFGILFPIALGYSSSMMPNRTLFYPRFVFLVFILVSSINIGLILKNIEIIDKVNIKIVCTLIILSGLVIETQYTPNGTMRIMEMPMVKMAMNNEKCLEESRCFRRIFENIYLSDDDEVRVFVDSLVRSDILHVPKIKEDPTYWVNDGIAHYYKKKGVSLIVEESE